MKDFQQVFGRFMERKEDLAARYGLTPGRPQWRENSHWAGLLIAIGNEFAATNPASPGGEAPSGEGPVPAAPYGPGYSGHPSPGAGAEQADGGRSGLPEAVLSPLLALWLENQGGGR